MALRVLHVLSGDVWGGAEAMVRDLAVAQSRRGVVEPACLVMNEGLLADELRKAGISVTVIDESRFNFVQIVQRARRQVGAWRPAVLHSHRAKEHVLAAILGYLGRRRGLPVAVVATIHGAPEFSRAWSDVRGRLADVSERIALSRGCAAVVAVSGDLAMRIRADLPTGPPPVVILNGIDSAKVREDSLRPVAGAPLPPRREGEIRLVAVGRLVTVKRFERLMPLAEMIAKLTARPVTILLAGDGPLRSMLDGVLSTAADGAEVLMLGFRAPVAPVIAAADALIITSDHEGVPIAALEAAVLCKPVFAFSVGGLPEIIGTRVPGVVVPPADIAAMARAVASQLGDAVGDPWKVTSVLDVGMTAAQYEALYRSVASANDAGAVNGGR
jgi:glycosyltransferase involved in cell wall biosynthesis